MEEGENPVCPPCDELGELRLVMSGFISGGEGMLEFIELTDGSELSMVPDSIESTKRKKYSNLITKDFQYAFLYSIVQ